MTEQLRTPGTPPGWVNTLMRVTLRTPMLQHLLGRMFALLTVTGATTGRQYVIPVQYLVHDGEFVVLSQRIRRWWKNFASRPMVEIRVEGESIHGRARIATSAEAMSVLADCLRREPRVARFYGLETLADGSIDTDQLDQLLDRNVVIMVTPHPIDVELEPADVVMQGF
jgi:deazaflavin-dependent oxidoreductase (nitroreductase family)